MADIEIYNTLHRTKEKFVPQKPGTVSFYTCGPTVYDTPHIGNYRTFVMYDIIRRVLEFNGFSVVQVMNVTDVDDKTIKRSHEKNIKLSELTKKYEDSFEKGLESLNIQKPTYITRATEYIGQMIDLTTSLLDKGVAYKAKDGVYLSIDKVANYGELAHLDLKGKTKERVANDEYDKENPRDFALWKFRTPDDGEVFWNAPFGEGRPGWHIECSAMSMKIFGPTIDLHAGGTDLIFPHHTNEIAQSESATGKKFVNYWVHGGFTNVNDEKMAKSKHNFIKLEDLEENSVSPLAYRYWLLTAHYRSTSNFSLDAVKGAQNALIRLLRAVGSYPDGGTAIPVYIEQFQAFINDDFDIPKAVALAWDLIRDPKQTDANKRAMLLEFDRVFGLRLASAPRFEAEDIPVEIKALADAREEARQTKDWKKADALRDEIVSRGYEIEDTDEGAKIRPAE